MGKKYPLRPETYKKIIERDQAPVPPQLSAQIMATAFAYADADRWAAYYRKAENAVAADIAAATRDRIYSDRLKPLLNQLVIS